MAEMLFKNSLLQKLSTFVCHESCAESLTERRSPVRVAKGERGVWQRRFWEHAIRDDLDYTHHIDYCHWNPMKHGLVQRVADWPYSSFHQYVHRGLILEDWAGGIAEQERLYGEST